MSVQLDGVTVQYCHRIRWIQIQNCHDDVHCDIQKAAYELLLERNRVYRRSHGQLVLRWTEHERRLTLRVEGNITRSLAASVCDSNVT